MQRMGKTRALSPREQEKRSRARSKTMTPPNIDLGKLCPELVIQMGKEGRSYLRDPSRLNMKDMEAIAATMLKLAGESRIKSDIISAHQFLLKKYKYGYTRADIYAAADLLHIEEDNLKKLLAARKGDGV